MSDLIKSVEKEFHGKVFCPSIFFWKLQRNVPHKVVRACRILNDLTPKQIGAVELYCRSCELEVEFNSSPDV